MKKLFLFFAGLLLALGVSYAQGSGAPVSKYDLRMTADTYRSLSASATVLFSPTEEMQINHKYIVKADSLVSVSVGKKDMYGIQFANLTKRAANIPLDKEFMYGTTKVRGIGFTTDGLLLFGDTVLPFYYGSEPGSNIYYITSKKINNFLYFNMADLNSQGKYGDATPLYARPGSKIGYEKDGDLLIIAYENLYIKESETEEQQISWNYQINLETGDIALQTRGFYSDATKNYPMRNFVYGLVGNKQAEQIWLSGFNPVEKKVANDWSMVSLGKDSLQEGALYSFTAPEKCQAVANPTVTWKMAVSDNDLSLAGTVWSDVSRAVFLLSENETLTTEKEPQDGKEFTGYNMGLGIISLRTSKNAQDSLWADRGWVAERTDKGVNGLSSHKIENLKASTDYWIHAYVYDNTCLDGPVYGTAVKQKITTSMTAPSSTGMVLSDVTLESFKLTVPALPEGESYMMAISEQTANGARNILKNGTVYQAGDKAGNGTIKYSGVGAGTYAFEGLKSGTDYYVWIWSSVGAGENIQYSAGCVELADKTIFELPVDIDFEKDDIYAQPLAWRLGMDEYTASASPLGWQVAIYKENSVGSGGFIAKAPSAGTHILCNQFFVDPKLEITYPKTIRVYAISPMINQSIKGELGVTFNVLFYTKDASGMGSDEKAYQLKDGDSLVISWAANRESTDWKRLAVVDKNTSFDADGFTAALVSGFNPESVFCFKLEFYHTASSDADPMGVAIQSLQIKQDLPCKAPMAIAVAQEDITVSSAVVKWEDGNPESAWAEKFLVRYRPVGQTDWMVDSTVDTEIVLAGLKHSTNYEINLQAVCGEEKGKSLEIGGNFSTRIALEIPYRYESGVQNELPTGSLNMRGLPGSDLVEIDPARDEPITGWAIDMDASSTTNTLLNNLEANSQTWLVLPALLPDSMGKVKLRLNITAFGLDQEWNGQEAFKSHDSLWVFVSMTGDFKTDRKTVGVVNIDDLHYRLVNDQMLYDTVDMEFSVDPGKGYSLAFYVPGKGASADYSHTMNNMLAIGSIEMTYASIEYPAVADIRVENLRQTGFRLSWKGEADSYKILFKEAVATKYDTINENTTSHTFEGLKEATRYAYRIYGVYAGKAGRLSDEETIRTLDNEVADTVAAPVFAPEAGIVAAGTVITISCATEDAIIYYTTDGSTPNNRSKRYLFGVSVDTSMVIKAVAVKEGWVDSRVAEAEYTVNVANEISGLAGVSLYPNPASGSFKMVLPVRAKVEIFTVNGMLVKSFMMPAGTEEMALDNSGIYVLRFTAENGSVAVKRLVIR